MKEEKSNVEIKIAEKYIIQINERVTNKILL